MPMYNLLEYSSNYYDMTRSLWFYSIDEATDLMPILVITIILNLSAERLNY